MSDVLWALGLGYAALLLIVGVYVTTGWVVQLIERRSQKRLPR